jgi:hypothetical protein
LEIEEKVMGNMLATGIVIFVSFWLLWTKLPLVTRLKLLGQPFLLDLVCSVGVFIMYGGTGAGLAAATMAALVISVNINFARKAFGYYKKLNGEWFYYAGRLNVSDKIVAEKRRRLYGKET